MPRTLFADSFTAIKLLFFFLYGKVKHNTKIFVEFEGGVKGFAGFAFEGFDDGGFTVGQQFRNLFVG